MAEYAELDVSKIDFGPAKIRKDMGDTTSLETSVRDIGLLQPIVVFSRGERYELVAGHRRLAAAKAQGWPNIPAMVIAAKSAPDAVVAGIAENLERLDLSHEEMGEAIMKLYQELGSFPAVATRLNRSEQWVRKWTGYHGVLDEIKGLVDQKKLAVAEAVRLMDMEPDRALAVANEIAARGLGGQDRKKAIRGAKKYSLLDPKGAVDSSLKPPSERPLTLRFVTVIMTALNQAAQARNMDAEDLAEDIVEDWLRAAKYLPAR